MKNLTKLFVAVAVLFTSFACTTDATQDLSVGASNGVGQTEFVLSLEESRTQLGEKAGDLYPLYWSNGDKISVNGAESNEISVNGQSSVATFSVSGTLTTPYCIAYPAAPAGEVVFADQQVYTGGTIANGASTMYGYSESGEGATLKHLTGILKIGVTGNKTLSYAQISTVDRKPIAGTFALNFANGEVSPTSTSKELIGYSFGEGVALSSEPTYLHVAVPAGVYEELYVTLYDNEGGVMYATIKAGDSKPLAAGMVREFSNTLVYAPNALVFVIRDKASLKAFAEEAATLEKDALFVADVDMTGEEWTPIEGYAKSVLGNGYSIKGLTAPLFGTTSASIKGLHLTDVAIVTNNDPVSAALARTVTATDAVRPEISHCSVSGTLVVENPTFSATAATSGSELTYAGLVARSIGAKIDNCVNNVSLTINNLTKPADETVIYGFYAGITAYSIEFTRSDASVVYSDVTNCTNNGAILLQDKSVPDATTTRTAYIGGIVCRSGDANAGVFSGNTNNGPITVTSLCYNSGGRAMIGGVLARGRHFSEFTNNVNSAKGKITLGPVTNVYVGGVIGYSNNVATEFLANLWAASNCHNHADITLESDNYASIHVGGVAGFVQYWDFTNCDNTGNISVKTTAATTKTDFNVGGWAGQYTGDSADARQPRPYYLTNSGTVTVDLHDATMSSTLRVAGLIAYSHASVRNSTTYKSAKVTLKGKIHQTVKAAVFNDNTSETQVTIGGFGGYFASTGSYDCTAENDLEVNTTWTGTNASFVQIGGLVGRTHNKLWTSIHTGNVTVNGDFSTIITNIGGCAGMTYWNNKDFVNEGNVTITGSYELLRVGGTVGAANHGVESHINKGNVTINATYNGASYIGGCVGYSIYDDMKDKPCINSDNYGKISVTGTQATTSDVAVGGVACYVTTSTGANTNLHNHEGADIYVNMTSSNGKIHIGGVMFKSKALLTNSSNSGNITIEGKVGNTLYIGGVLTAQNGQNRTDLTNNGKITLGCSAKGSCFVGGICYDGQYNKVWDNCHNHGDIEFTKAFTNTVNVRVGGILGKFETADQYNIFKGCSNSGNISFHGHSDSYVYLGGLVGHLQSSAIVIIQDGYTNSGNITYTGDVAGADNVMLGGLIGRANATSKFIRTTSTTTGEGEDAVTTTTSTTWTGNIVNTGKITLTGLSEGGFLHAGGFFGSIENTNTPFHETAKYYQLGDLEYAGTPGVKEGVAGTGRVGGVIASSLAPVSNVECYCTINAPTATYLGMIMGVSRTPGSVVATNCKVGGTVLGEYNEEDETFKTTVIDESNFHNYIFSSGEATDWTGTDNYDGCSALTAKPVVE